jgi:GST-like protein
MIEFYTAQTSNGHRVAIVLEECGLAYRTHKLDLFKGEQRNPDYLALNPAGQIPTIVDPDGPGGKPLTLGQSGAIVLYLAEKAGKFLPADRLRRIDALQWLMFTMTDVAPASTGMFFQSVLMPDKSTANDAFWEQRVARFFRLADRHLAGREWLAGELSVADFALYPIYAGRKAIADAAGDLPDLARWGQALAARPGVARGMQVSG